MAKTKPIQEPDDLFPDELQGAFAQQAQVVADRVLKLREQIRHHDALYYDCAEPEISDLQYDELAQELRKQEAVLADIDKNHPALCEPSPLHKVGGSVAPNMDTVVHPAAMLSIDNTYNEGELRAFDKRVREALPTVPDAVEYVVELKIDGVALAMMYAGGALRYAATRGNGEVGEVITPNMLRSREVAPAVSAPLANAPELELRGEAYFTFEDFEKINEQLVLKDRPKAQNPRNLVAGTVKRKDALTAAARRVRVFFYAIGHCTAGADFALPTTHAGVLELLEQCGLPVNPHRRLCANIDEVLEFVHEWDTRRNTLPYPTDGLVVKVNRRDYWSLLGATAKSPRYMIAFKYGAQRAATTVTKVEWQVGRTGALTPVAFLAPVALSGTTVKKATLHNHNEIVRLGLRIGDTVEIEKGGEIIPKIIGVVATQDLFHQTSIAMPQVCPECRQPLTRPEKEVALYCTNVLCPGRLVASMLHYVGRGAMDIQGLGDVQISSGVQRGKLKSFADIYDCTEDDWATIFALRGDTRKSVEQVLKEIDESKSQPLHRFLFALGIRFVGETAARAVAQTFADFDAIAAATVQQLTAIDGVGEVTARAVVDYFANEQNRMVLARLKKAGLAMPNPLYTPPTADETETADHPIRGKTFVLTGALATMKRDEAKEKILARGGTVAGSVSGKTHYVVAGADALGTTKLLKAQAAGVRILTEDEFLRLLAATL